MRLRGLRQTDLADRLGTDQGSISKYCTGDRLPSFDLLRSIADTLSVSVDYLMGRDVVAAAGGPLASKLLHDFARMSSPDQEYIASFARFMTIRFQLEITNDKPTTD